MQGDKFQVNNVHRYEALLRIGYMEWTHMLSTSFIRNEAARTKEQWQACREMGIFCKDSIVIYPDFGRNNVDGD